MVQFPIKEVLFILNLLKCYKIIHGLDGLNCNDYLNLIFIVKQGQAIIKLRQPLAIVTFLFIRFLLE